MKGWIKLHRETIKSETWNQATPERKVLMITLLLLASHQESEVCGVELHPGQLLISLRTLVEKCGKGITIQNVRSGLNWLEKQEFLTKKSTQLSTHNSTHKSTQQQTLITLVKYRVYQHSEEKSTQESTQESTQKSTLFKNNKNKEEEEKESFSVVFMKMMKELKPGLVIDESEDLKHLHQLSKKIRKHLQEANIKEGFISWAVPRKSIIEYFETFCCSLDEWVFENRFFPEYLNRQFSTLANKHQQQQISEKKKNSISLTSFKNIIK